MPSPISPPPRHITAWLPRRPGNVVLRRPRVRPEIVRIRERRRRSITPKPWMLLAAFAVLILLGRSFSPFRSHRPAATGPASATRSSLPCPLSVSRGSCASIPPTTGAALAKQ